eukprot:TRINITY_DN2859_c0_g1_i1.p1 TRINITY_DN2859_c0_g1~~TRINITY_DN2859_c0_g1_i1.p1  ORF type:complete len:519 (+),score=118.77 TRINITY_DN2859_c0_g1_i1:114-1670(+)
MSFEFGTPPRDLVPDAAVSTSTDSADLVDPMVPPQGPYYGAHFMLDTASQGSYPDHDDDGCWSAPEFDTDGKVRGRGPAGEFKRRLQKAQGQWRARLTGDPERRVRDALREDVIEKHLGAIGGRIRHVRQGVIENQRRRVRNVKERVEKIQQTPQIMRVLDRVAFTNGVLGIVISEWVLLQQPHYFWLLYLVVMPQLLIARLFLYFQEKMQYFLLDFCYYVQVLCILQVLFPSEQLFRLVFVFSNGPLGWAIVAWRNSLVFHSFDKVTSVYIHAYPMLLTYVMRWRPAPGQTWGQDQGWLSAGDLLGFPILAYLCWQTAYLVFTEVVGPPRRDPTLVTALRYLADSGDKSPTVKFVRGLCVKLGIMHKDERFNSQSVKTKAIMVGFQLCYTTVTLLPTFFIYSSEAVHLFFMLFCMAQCVWNGASYYFEVFASSYRHAKPRRQQSGGVNSPTTTRTASGPVKTAPEGSSRPPSGSRSQKPPTPSPPAGGSPRDGSLRRRRPPGSGEAGENPEPAAERE